MKYFEYEFTYEDKFGNQITSVLKGYKFEYIYHKFLILHNDMKIIKIELIKEYN